MNHILHRLSLPGMGLFCVCLLIANCSDARPADRKVSIGITSGEKGDLDKGGDELAQAESGAQPLLSGRIAPDCDADIGERAFAKCASCHSLEPGKNMMGPSLAGVVGRRVGAAKNYHYSEAVRAEDGVWTEDRLLAFLESPQEEIPGNVMPFSGIARDQERRAILCWIGNADQQERN